MARKLSTFVVSLTPFTEDGQLDEDAFRRHLRRFASSGIGVYVGGSGSSEACTFSDRETRRVLEIAKEELVGKVPVRAMGIEPPTSQHMIDYCRLVKEIGLDATQIYSLDIGHGVQPTEREVELYLSEVLEHTDSPVVLSTHGTVSGYLIPVVTIARMVERYPYVIGINVSTAEIQYIAQLIDAVGDRIDVHAGWVAHTLTTLALGGSGFLSAEANVAPRLCASLIAHYEAGRYSEAEQAFRGVMSMQPIRYKFGGIRGTKAALRILGLPGGYTRKPRLDLPNEVMPEVARFLDAIKIRSMEGVEAAIQ